MSVRLGVNPIGWSNDDLQDIGGDISLETCLSEAREAGFEGMEKGHKLPSVGAALKAKLAELDAALETKIRDTLRREYTPRHVPDKIYQAPGIPYTLTGKKMEVPVRRILTGVPPEKAANRSGVSDPGSLDFFIAYAARQQDYPL